MAAGAGYTIKQEETDDSARELDKAARDLGAVLGRLPAPQCSSPAAFGGEEAAPAYDNFVEAWLKEGKVLQAALEEIADKLRVTTNNYRSAEHEAIGGLSSAAGLGAGAEAAGGVGTGAAPGVNPFG